MVCKLLERSRHQFFRNINIYLKKNARSYKCRENDTKQTYKNGCSQGLLIKNPPIKEQKSEKSCDASCGPKRVIGLCNVKQW